MRNASIVIDSMIRTLRAYLNSRVQNFPASFNCGKFSEIRYVPSEEKQSYNHFTQSYHPYKTNPYIQFPDNIGKRSFTSGFRNPELTVERIKNICCTIHNLQQLSAEDTNDESHCMECAKGILSEARRKNMELTTKYGESHRTSRENRERGLNPVSAWYHKTWIQSQAHVALEQTLSIAEKWAPTHGAEEGAGAPSTLGL